MSRRKLARIGQQDTRERKLARITRVARGGWGGAVERACAACGKHGGTRPCGSRWSRQTSPVRRPRRSLPAPLAACCAARGGWRGGRRAARLAAARAKVAVRSPRRGGARPRASTRSVCSRVGSVSIVELRRRLLQRCSRRLLGLGARAIAVASRDDGASVSKPNGGAFCKNSNIETGQETALYMP
jgi:hypothetical protein